MTYWRMTKKVQSHPEIAAGETVVQASYGLSNSVVQFANRVDGIRHFKVWTDEMGEAEGLAEPLKNSGVLALTDRRLLFFPQAVCHRPAEDADPGVAARSGRRHRL